MAAETKVFSLLGIWEYDYEVIYSEEDGYEIHFADFDIEDPQNEVEELPFNSSTFCLDPEDIEVFARDWLTLVIYSSIVDGWGDTLPAPRFHGDHTMRITFKDFLEIKDADECEEWDDDEYEEDEWE